MTTRRCVVPATALLCLASALSTGCSALQSFAERGDVAHRKREAEHKAEQRRAYVEAHPDLHDAIKERILAGKIMLIMTDEQVHVSWGPPRRNNRRVGPWGVHEQWVYGYHERVYLYFENGILTSWSGPGLR